jgi:hypothetical protein
MINITIDCLLSVCIALTSALTLPRSLLRLSIPLPLPVPVLLPLPPLFPLPLPHLPLPVTSPPFLISSLTPSSHTSLNPSQLRYLFHNLIHYLIHYLDPPSLCLLFHQVCIKWSALPLFPSEETVLLIKVVFSDILPDRNECTVNTGAVSFFKFEMSNFSGLIVKGGKKREEKGRKSFFLSFLSSSTVRVQTHPHNLSP